MLNEAALRWMNDLSEQGILITDGELAIRVWNHWLEIHSGHPAAEMIGRNLFEAYPELAARGLDRYYKDALGGQARVLSHKFHQYLLSMVPQAELFPFAQMQQSARIAPLVEGDLIIGTITVIDDVTERVARERELVQLLAREQEARQQAEAANRAKDEFLATVSHELRTPLNAIAGWVQILRNEDLAPDYLAHGLRTVERNVRAQTKIIEDIMDVSRIIMGKLSLNISPVDLVQIIEAALDAVRPAAEGKGIGLQSQFDRNAGLVSGDPNRLQQVVWNLVSNGIKFTPKGGQVIVGLKRNESQAEIIVSDTGRGISAEFLPYVFDRFRQADQTSTRQQSGLGLGLALVHYLVEAHGGSVAAASPGEGLGATFTVRLPLMAVDDSIHLSGQSAGRAESNEAGSFTMSDQTPDELPQLDGRRVLIVDDEPDARELLRLILTQYGAEVRLSASAQDALEILKQWLPDVLISDVGMPDKDGYDLINQIRSLGKECGGEIPAVALTGYARPEDRSRLLSAGYQVYLSKPVEMAELANSIASLTKKTG